MFVVRTVPVASSVTAAGLADATSDVDVVSSVR